MIPYYSYPGIAIEKKPCTDREIVAAVCNVFNVSEDDLMSVKKTRNLAFPRQVAMSVMRHYKRTFKHAADVFKRDHTTCMHAVKTVKDIMDTDERQSENVYRVYSLLNRKHHVL